MPSSRIPSPARSQGVISTPRRDKLRRRTRSVSSPARSNISVRLSTLVSNSFKVSPIPNRKSILNDDTDIEGVPGRKSWWKKLNENSRDVLKALETKDMAEIKNVADEFDVEVLSQEEQNYTLDLPDSSDGESIMSIEIPQRKLFTQKENFPQKKFDQILNKRDSQPKHKSHVEQDKDIDVVTKHLFSQPSKPRNKPVFPAALLNISANKTMNKTKEMPVAEVKGQVRSLFGNRPGTKRKNMFVDFIASDSENDISEIQPKVFGFQNNAEKKYRESSNTKALRHSPRSSIDLDLDEWQQLPSSTMVGNQLEDTTPVKRARLSKLSEIKESETMSTVNKIMNKTKNKSVNSKNKSKISSSSKLTEANNSRLEDVHVNMDLETNDQSVNNSNMRLTRNKSRSKRDTSLVEGNLSKNMNKSKNITTSEQQKLKNKSNLIEKEREPEIKQIQEEGDDEDFTLEYDNNDQNIDCLEENANKTGQSELKNNKVNSENNKASEQIFDRSTNKQLNKTKENIIDKDIDLLDGKVPVKSVQLNNEHEKLINEKLKKNTHQLDNIKNITNLSMLNKSENVGKIFQNNVVESNSNKEECGAKSDKSRKSHSEIVNLNQEMECDDEDHVKNEQLNEDNSKENESNEKSSMQENADNIEHESNNGLHSESEENNKSVSDKEEENHETDENVSDEEHNESQEVQHESQEDEKEEIESEQEQNESDVQNDAEDQEEMEVDNEEENENSEDDTNQLENQDFDAEEQNTNELSVNNSDKNVTESKEENVSEDGQENNSGEVNDTEEHETGNEEENDDAEEEEVENEDQYAENEEHETENDLEANESGIEENEDESEQIDHDDEHNEESDQIEEHNEQDNEIAKSNNDESPNMTQEGTAKRRNTGKVKSPEVILHDKTNQLDSFVAEGRNTTVRKTKSMLVKTLNIRPSLVPVRESTGFSDGTRDSSADNSGWDSHRTTRKTLRQTFGKDFTLRKSLRALVMEKSAKRHTNFMDKQADMTENVDNTKIPQANSTELPHFDSYEEAEPVQVEETEEENVSEDEQENNRGDVNDTEEETENEEENGDAEEEEVENEDQDAENQEHETENDFEANESGTVAEVDHKEHEMSQRTRQTTLEMYLQKIKQENLEKKRKIEEQVRNSMKTKAQPYNLFKVPSKPIRRVATQNKRPKQTKPIVSRDLLPPEVMEDMKYKPPKRFQPNNASWITKRLYKFLETKLEPKYDYKARVRAEKLVEMLYNFTKEVKRHETAPSQAVDSLKHEMARLGLVQSHFDFYQFFHGFMPREIRIKVVPDIVNKISLPKHGVFSDILR